MPLGEIAEQLALPKSGTHRLLATLVDRGWAEKDPDTSFYRLTMRLAVLGQQFFVATGIPDIWQPILDRFAQRCHEFARLAVVDGIRSSGSRMRKARPAASCTSIAHVEHRPAVRHGQRQGVARNAFHRAGNAARDEERRPQGRGPLRAQRRALGGRAAPRNPGHRPSRLWLAFNEAEFGVSAVAAAIRAGDGGPVLGTVSIAGPSARITDKRAHELAPVVLETAQELSNLWPLRVGTGSKERPREGFARLTRRRAAA
jgi:DNA-binding IclR family transcriptional regulator